MHKGTAADGDYRILGGTVKCIVGRQCAADTTANLFAKNAKYDTQDKQAHSLWVLCRSANQPIVTGASMNNTRTLPHPRLRARWLRTSPEPRFSAIPTMGDLNPPVAPQDLKGAINSSGRPGDWDTGTGIFPDGPYLNVVDQIDVAGRSAYVPSIDSGGGIDICFSPNRRIASAIQLGSLPTGVSAVPNPRPWETLLLLPELRPPAAWRPEEIPRTRLGTLAFRNPPDHMFLENFTIPVVEPATRSANHSPPLAK